MRLFTAIDLPDSLKAALAARIAGFSRLKWTCPEQLHLTLRFIGETDPSRLPEIIAALHRVAIPDLTLRTDGTGFFPGSLRPQVFWFSIAPASGLLRLQQEIENALTEIGLSGEERYFIPHITLARFRHRPQPGLTAALERQFATLPAVTFQARSFHLYSSILEPGGAIHTVETSFRR